VGLDYTWTPTNSWLGVDAGLQYSWDRGNVDVGSGIEKLDNYVLEFSVGVRKALDLERLHLRPYVGVGASLLYSRFEGTDGMQMLTDEDGVLGGYGKAGIVFQLTPSQHIGIEYRGVRAADSKVAGVDVGNDYDQLALVFGARF
jgi:opacity protein-like surface antigen